jgi:hypothetical protein
MSTKRLAALNSRSLSVPLTVAREDTDPICNPQLLGQLDNFPAQSLIIGTNNCEVAVTNSRECVQQSIKAFLPTKSPKEKDEWLLLGNSFDVGGDLSTTKRLRLDTIGMIGTWGRRQLKRSSSSASSRDVT